MNSQSAYKQRQHDLWAKQQWANKVMQQQPDYLTSHYPAYAAPTTQLAIGLHKLLDRIERQWDYECAHRAEQHWHVHQTEKAVVRPSKRKLVPYCPKQKKLCFG